MQTSINKFMPIESIIYRLYDVYTLHLHCMHAAANLNSGYSKYEKVARVHYFCTMALRTPYVHVSIVYGAFMLV